MSVQRRTALMCAMLVVAQACATNGRRAPAVDAAADAEAIKAAFAEWVRASEAGDAEAYGRYITDDAVFMGPGASAISGKATLVPWVAGWFAEWQFSFPEWSTEEVIVAGDVAIHRYSGIATLTPKNGGAPTAADRKYMDVLRRESDGRWRVARHMFNLNR